MKNISPSRPQCNKLKKPCNGLSTSLTPQQTTIQNDLKSTGMSLSMWLTFLDQAYRCLAQTLPDRKINSQIFTHTISLNTADECDVSSYFITKNQTLDQKIDDWLSVTDILDAISLATPDKQVELQWSYIANTVVDLFLNTKQKSKDDLSKEDSDLITKHVKKTIIKGDQSLLIDFSSCQLEIFKLQPSLFTIGLAAAQNTIRALNLKDQTVNMEQLINQLNQLQSLSILNLQGVKSISNRNKLRILAGQQLAFLNISCMELTNEDVKFAELPKLTEIICHTNRLTSIGQFLHLSVLQLLDVENNKIESVEQDVSFSIKTLNLKGNPLHNQAKSNLDAILLTNSSVQQQSLFAKFGKFAFGDSCKPYQSKRCIKVCFNQTNSSSQLNTSYESQTEPLRYRKLNLKHLFDACQTKTQPETIKQPVLQRFKSTPQPASRPKESLQKDTASRFQEFHNQVYSLEKLNNQQKLSRNHRPRSTITPQVQKARAINAMKIAKPMLSFNKNTANSAKRNQSPLTANLSTMRSRSSFPLQFLSNSKTPVVDPLQSFEVTSQFLKANQLKLSLNVKQSNNVTPVRQAVKRIS